MVAAVGNKLALLGYIYIYIYIYATCGKVALEHQKHIYLQSRKLKHLVYVTQEGVTQVGSNQPRVVVVAPPENNGS